MKRILILAAAVIAGCSDSPKAPQVDIGAVFGIAQPPAAVLAPAPPRALPMDAEFERLLKDLESEDPAVRTAAEDGLVALGETALARLDALGPAADPEVASRAASAARRIRLGDALWLADLIERNWREEAQNPLNSVAPVDGLLETLRQPLAPVLADRKAWRRLLDELGFAEKYMTDPERVARVAEVRDAHADIGEQLAALMAEVEKDPDFLDTRHRRAVAEIVRIHSLGLRANDLEVLYDALRPCGSWKGAQAALVLPALSEVARRHPNPQTRGYARGYLLGMLAEGTDWLWGGLSEAWPGPVPHTSRLSRVAKDLVPWMMELASSGDPAERSWALRTVGHLGDPSVVPAVLRAFRDDRPVRADAFRALVTLGAPEARPAILEVLGNPGDPALVPALHTCAHFRPEEAHDPVAAIFDAPPGDPEARAASIALCALARAEDLPRLARIVESWTPKSGIVETTPGFSAVLRLRPPDSPDRRRIAAACGRLLKAESGSVRLASAWVLESFDARAGVRAWASLLDDFTFTEGRLRLPISWTAIGALERLTGVAFRGGEGIQTQEWRDWWAEHHGEYEEK